MKAAPIECLEAALCQRDKGQRMEGITVIQHLDGQQEPHWVTLSACLMEEEVRGGGKYRHGEEREKRRESGYVAMRG